MHLYFIVVLLSYTKQDHFGFHSFGFTDQIPSLYLVTVRKILANHLHRRWLRWGTWSSHELSWSSTPRRLGSRLAGRRTPCWAFRHRRGCQSEYQCIFHAFWDRSLALKILPGLGGSPRSSCRIPSVRPSTPIGCLCQRWIFTSPFWTW